MKSNTYKLEDSELTLNNSAGDKIFNFQSIYLQNAELYNNLRKPNLSQKIYGKETIEKILLDTYKLRSIEYGRWVSYPDRVIFAMGLILSLHDLNKILHFGNNLGFGVLNQCFGSRGVAKALAHYQPTNHIINLSKFRGNKNLNNNININYLKSSGIGSFAHEYGHFIDYYFGQKSGLKSLTNGSKTNVVNRGKVNYDSFTGLGTESMAGLMSNLMYAIIFDKEKTSANSYEFSPYYKKLVETYKKKPYWYQPNEIFARFFESWVAIKLEKLGIHNFFLTAERKYDTNQSIVYMNKKEILAVDKLMLKLLQKMEDLIK